MTCSASTRNFAPLLPEDGRAQGFDKVGEALDLSSVHLQRAMDAARQALNAAMNKGEAPTMVDQTIAFDAGRNAQHIGKSWHKLADGSVVTFNEATYPALMAEFEAPTAGLYRVTLRGRAYQTDKPIMVTVFSGPFFTGSPTRFQVGPGILVGRQRGQARATAEGQGQGPAIPRPPHLRL